MVGYDTPTNRYPIQILAASIPAPRKKYGVPGWLIIAETHRFMNAGAFISMLSSTDIAESFAAAMKASYSFCILVFSSKWGMIVTSRLYFSDYP